MKQLCTFYVANHLYGIGVESVQEILRYQQLTPIPLAPPEVRGLINLRGEIVAAIDLRARLELPPRGPHEEPTNVVLRSQDGAISLLVDEIGDVLDVDEESFEPPPETLRGAARRLVRGVYKLPEQLLLALSLEDALDVDTRRSTVAVTVTGDGSTPAGRN